MRKIPKNFHWQERDRRIFDDLVECGGLLDFATIHQRRFPDDRTGEACRRRLALLCAHDLLEVYRPAIWFGRTSSGRQPAVYRMTAKSAELLRELTGAEPQVQSGGLSSLTLEHRLGMAKLRLMVNDACVLGKLPSPRWIGEYDPWPGRRLPAKAKLSERFRLCHQYEMNGTEVTCWPDAASIISVADKESAALHRLLILWEYDRSTERLAQVVAKLAGYKQFLDRRDDRRLFADVEVSRTRVFMVARSDERRVNIANAIRNEPGSEAFRLGVAAELSPQSLLRKPVWRTVKGESQTIIATG